MRVTDSRFERAAVGAADEPPAVDGDIVFLGRSNVGKSSLINRLLGAEGLARTSSTPGRTQTVNFYRVNERHFFVDLPGYGYARAPEAVRGAWGGMVEGFLTRRRPAIAAAIVLVDARREVGELDRTMLGWLVDRDVPVIVVAVKADKLNQGERVRAERGLAAALPVEDGGVAPFLVSAHSGLGIASLWKEIDAALAAHRKDERWTSVS
jgi:GTP-binding protein